MGTVCVVERLVLAKGVQEMRLVPDQRPVEQFPAAGAYPPFHDRVHPRYLNAAADDGDSGVGENLVEQRRVLPVTIADQVPGVRPGILQVHDEGYGRPESPTQPLGARWRRERGCGGWHARSPPGCTTGPRSTSPSR